jgi:hypothetical protein
MSSRWLSLKKVLQQPFPELTSPGLLSPIIFPALPDSFLGGSAPRVCNDNSTSYEQSHFRDY